jgi:hypothetical protein
MVKDKEAIDNGEIRDEDAARLLDTYQNASSNFQRSFSILIGFALIFVFIFLLPYVSNLDKSYNIDAQIAMLDANITEHNQNILLLDSAQSGLKNLSSILTQFPSELDKTFVKLKLIQISDGANKFMINVNRFLSQPRSQDELNKFSKIMSDLSGRINSVTNEETPSSDEFETCENLNSSLRNYCNQSEKIHYQLDQFVNTNKIKYGTQNSSYLFPGCDSKFEFATNEWASCNLREKIESQLDQISRTLLQNVSVPLKMIENRYPLSELQILQRGISDLKNSSRQTGSNPLFANESGIMQLKKLEKDINIFRQAYNNTIEPTRVKLHNDIIQQSIQQGSESRNLNLTKNLLVKDLQSSLSDRNKLEYRLNQTEFPFGKIPINLDESIAAFPVALGVGFLVSASYLANSIQLRKELHVWYKSKYKEVTKNLLDERIGLIAPLWINPSNSVNIRIMKFAIFMIPLFTFIWSIFLISNYVLFRQENETLASLFSYGSFLNPFIYLGIYLVCSGFFLYGISITIIAIRRYATVSTKSSRGNYP